VMNAARSNPRARARSKVGILLLALLLAGCAAARGGRAPTFVLLPEHVAAPPPTDPAPGIPRVHIVISGASSPVELRRITGWELVPYNLQSARGSVEGSAVLPLSQRVCMAPCGAMVDGREDRVFFLGGPGIHASELFSLGGATGEVTFRVHPGSETAYQAGVPLTFVGAGGAALGATLLVLAGAFHGRGLVDTGVVVASAGVGSLVAGIELWTSGTTTYTVAPLPPPPGEGSNRSARGVALGVGF